MSGKIIPRVTKVECMECGHKWIPRSENPTACPRCHSLDWDGVKHLTPAQYRRSHQGVPKPVIDSFEELKRRLGK